MFTIIGATGNIGSKLTGMLLSSGKKVKAIGRSAERLRPLVDKGAESAVGKLEDTDFLIGAFRGAEAVFAMIPPKYDAEDFRAYQNNIGSSIAMAVMDAGVKHVVNLSSQGAHLPEGTGPILGLRDQEERLNALGDTDVLHLRPAFFMENLLMQVPLIRGKGIMGSPLNGDLHFPMIATRDIAEAAAARMITLDFKGKSVMDLLGERDLSMREAARIIGAAIDMPGLAYVQFSYGDAEEGMIAAGLSPDMSRLMVQMHRAFNDGLVVFPERTAENTTGTSMEEFAKAFARIFEAEG